MPEPVDLDDVDRPDWYSGPPPKITRGPVITAYVDTHALDVECINCGAKPGEFCRHDTGQDRKMPCPRRIAAAARAAALTEGRP